jgi:hypothetical protein
MIYDMLHTSHIEGIFRVEFLRLPFSAKLSISEGALHSFSLEKSLNGCNIELQEELAEMVMLDCPQ